MKAHRNCIEPSYHTDHGLEHAKVFHLTSVGQNYIHTRTHFLFFKLGKKFMQHRLNCLKIYVWIEYNGMKRSSTSLCTVYTRIHIHIHITYRTHYVLCWCINLFVWCHCLCSLLSSFCPDSYPKKLHYFIMRCTLCGI